MFDTWLTIINPHAGNGRTLSKWKLAYHSLRELGMECVEKYTDSRYHAMNIAAEAAMSGFRKFLVVGGDGTIHETVNGIISFIEESKSLIKLSDFTLAVLPIGSGNDWVKSHNLPKDSSEIVKLISNNSFIDQDIFKVESDDKTSYMINIAGFGFDARICEHVENSKSSGRGGKSVYIRTLLRTLFTYKPSEIELICDRIPVYKGATLSISFGNGRFSGGGMIQTPLAKFDDGLLDITVIPKLSILKILWHAIFLFKGTILEIPEVLSFRAKSVKLNAINDSRNECIEVDGEVIGTSPINISLYPHRLRVLHLFK